MRLLRIMTVVGMVAATLTGAAGAAAGAVPDSTSHWQVAATLGRGLGDIAVSCPTAAVCTAAEGGELVTTADGGATWVRSTPALPADVATVVDLDCPTTSVCVVVGRRTDGGTAVLTGRGSGPFTAATAPDAGTATGIACPGPSHCLLTDGRSVWTTRDRGTTWRASALPAFAYSDQQITCVTGTRRCVVFGNNGFTPIVDVTTDDGRTWTQQDPGSFDGLYGLDCGTVDVCVAGGRAGGVAVLRRTTDGGATWKPLGTPGQPYGVRGVSCATATACTAVGLTPGDTPYVWSTADGTTWTAQTVTPFTTRPSPEVDCPDAGHCRVVGGGISYVTDDGSTWTDGALPSAPDEPRAISCTKATSCVAVSVDAAGRPVSLTSTDTGRTWTPHALPATLGQPTSISCVAATTACTVVGAYAPPGNGLTVLRSAVTTDLGATWTAGREGNVQGYLWSVSCPSTTTCLAAGYDRRSRGMLWLTTNGGRTWTVPTPPAGLSQDSWVSCTGPTTCVVASSPSNARPVAFTTTDLGTTWRQRLLPGDPDNRTYYGSLSCAATTCVAVGANAGTEVIAYSADGATTWRRGTVPFVQGSLGAVSCASPTACASPGAVFGSGGGAVAISSTDGGATWEVHRVDGGHVGYRISCAGTRCYSPTTDALGRPAVVSGLV